MDDSLHPPEDYHSPAPVRVPRIPITLTGFFGSQHDDLANRVGAFTGLPTLVLPRLVSHQAGCDVDRLIERSGRAAYASLESECLTHFLAQQPPGILALSPSTLVDPTHRAVVTAHSVLVHVACDFKELGRRIRKRLESQPRTWAPWIDPDRADEEHLLFLHEERRAGFEAAALQVDLTDGDLHQATRSLIDLLQLWTPDP